jgi:hypothetical protein
MTKARLLWPTNFPKYIILKSRRQGGDFLSAKPWLSTYFYNWSDGVKIAAVADERLGISLVG